MKEEKEQRHKMVVFNENNVMGAKIDNITFMLQKLSHNRQCKSFEPRVYQGSGQPLTNSGMGSQYYKNNRNRFYDKDRPYDKS